MKKLIILLIIPALISAPSFAQIAPSLSAFTNTTQRSQLAAYAIWAAKVEAKKSADSLGKVYEARIKALEEKYSQAVSLRKTLLDSLQNYSLQYKQILDSIAALRTRFNGLNTAIWRATENNSKLIAGMKDTVIQLIQTVQNLPASDTSWRPQLNELQRKYNSAAASVEELTVQLKYLNTWADKLRAREYNINFK